LDHFCFKGINLYFRHPFPLLKAMLSFIKVQVWKRSWVQIESHEVLPFLKETLANWRLFSPIGRIVEK